jgi:hypothetical protein
VGQIKGLLSWNTYSKRDSWTTALSLTEQRAKGSARRKNTTLKKDLLSLLPRVTLQMGEVEVDEDDAE